MAAASTAGRDEVMLGVALFYLSAALSHLEDEHGFSLPRSRRLSGHWIRRLQLGRAGGGAAPLGWLHSAAGSQLAGPAPAGTPAERADVTEAATQLLVSAFRERCARHVGRDLTRDALLDRVVVLALERAHETCAAIDTYELQREHHGLGQAAL